MGDILQVAGYVAALLIGLTLGLMGSGGSTLAVPVLVFLFGVDPVRATGYSLFVVGITALVGTLRNTLAGSLDLRPAVAFALSSMASVYLMRRHLVPAAPDPLASFGEFILSKSSAVLALFAILMVFSALAMIRSNEHQRQEVHRSSFQLMLYGFAVGGVTGAVGAGGGFLIVPALVMLCGMPMKVAVPTSLAIIAVNSLIGFAGELHSGQFIEWPFVLTFSGITILGMAAGQLLSTRVPTKVLRPMFGYFILLMGVFTLAGAMYQA